MDKKKNVLAMLLTGTMAISLSGCGGVDHNIPTAEEGKSINQYDEEQEDDEGSSGTGSSRNHYVYPAGTAGGAASGAAAGAVAGSKANSAINQSGDALTKSNSVISTPKSGGIGSSSKGSGTSGS